METCADLSKPGQGPPEQLGAGPGSGGPFTTWVSQPFTVAHLICHPHLLICVVLLSTQAAAEVTLPGKCWLLLPLTRLPWQMKQWVLLVL